MNAVHTEKQTAPAIPPRKTVLVGSRGRMGAMLCAKAPLPG